MSSWAARNQVLGDDLERLHAENYGVHGVWQIHRLPGGRGWLLGRDQVARVLKTLGIAGVRRGQITFTTRSKSADSYPAYKVNRQFRAEGPNQPWVSDITYVAKWSG